MHHLILERACYLSVREATADTVAPFSWMSTKEVCQMWSAHFAAWPTGTMPQM
jgi:hypothetical protein